MSDNLDKKSDIGNLYKFLKDYTHNNEREMCYLNGKFADFEQWKSVAKAKFFELANYFPKEAPLDSKVLEIKDKGLYRQEEIEFSTAKNVRVRGSILIPNAGKEKYPAIIAIHDHGGFYYYGREKIMEIDNEPQTLTEFKKDCYGERSWANDLVKRGYIVLCIDGFYFGSRRLDLDSVSDEMFGRVTPKERPIRQDFDNESDYINKYNEICWNFEGLFLRHTMIAGTTWPGILLHDDRKCIDYLYSRKEVDINRIGCCGLSIGGFRSAHLAALDSRIKASIVAGWMTTYESLLFNRLRSHTYMIYVPNLTKYMDLPDLMSLVAPNSLFVQQCTQDSLYTVDGMSDACNKIEELYDKLGYGDRFKYEFYNNGHQFNLKMQEDAFAWLDKIFF